MEKNKTTALVIIGIIVFAAIPLSAAATNDILVTYYFDRTEIVNWLETGKPMKNLQVQALAGEPLVPYTTARILLPPYTEVANVHAQAASGQPQVVDNIPCGQPPSVIGEEPTIVEKNPDVYNSNELHPKMIYSVGSVDSLHGYNILYVELYPVQYRLASRLAIYYTEMTVRVTLKAGGRMDTFRQLDKDQAEVEKSVDNPWTVATYDSLKGSVGIQSTTYEYLIITTVPLLDEFQVLANWKAKWVNGARVETVSAGATAQEVKNVINDYYTYYSTDYVLLGGDVGVLPYHTKQVMGTNIAEDYWFANLVGDDDISEYEVYIGRAPVDNEAEATSFVKKVISYEQMTKPMANLFHQSRVAHNNIPDSRELAWQCQNYVPPGYINYELFEENGRIERADWINFWRNKGILFEHIGHGSTTCYYINYEVGGGSVSWCNPDVASLDNTFWPVHTSVACHTGEFEYEDCLAETYVKDSDHGAIACLMNDKYGWYMSFDATYFSGDFIEMQFHSLYQEFYQKIGAILARCKAHFIDEATNPNNPYRAYWEWCWREINLIGDPESPVLTKRSSPPATPSTPSGPTSGYVGRTYTYTTSTTDPEGDKVRYEFNWDDGTTTLTGWYNSSDTASASHSWSDIGTYHVKVHAQDYYDAWSGFSPVRNVTISQGGGGCPFVYVWDGNQYVLDNNVLPTSELSQGADVEDYYVLQKTPVPTNLGSTLSFYSFRLGEFEKEHSYIDQVKFIAVDHDPNVNIAVTPSGEILTYRNPSAPLSCSDDEGANRLGEISRMDGDVSDPHTFFEGYPGDYLVLNFGKVDSENAKLIFRTDMKKMEECIDVQVMDEDGVWQTLETLVPRAYWAMEAVNIAQYINGNRDLWVRLFWKFHHRIDYVGLDTTPQESYTLRTAVLVSAVHSEEGNVMRELILNDNNYAELTPGQEIWLRFALPNPELGKATTFIFYTEGYYRRTE